MAVTMILHISVQFPFHMATWFVALGRHRGFLASPLISSADHGWERKWTLSSKSRTECLQEKFWPFFNVFPSGLFPSGRPSLISWLFTESRDAWGLLEEKQTSIENICCRKFSTSLPLSSPLCFSFLKSEGLRRLKRLNIQARGGRGHQHYESPGTSH